MAAVSNRPMIASTATLENNNTDFSIGDSNLRHYDSPVNLIVGEDDPEIMSLERIVAPSLLQDDSDDNDIDSDQEIDDQGDVSIPSNQVQQPPPPPPPPRDDDVSATSATMDTEHDHDNSGLSFAALHQHTTFGLAPETSMDDECLSNVGQSPSSRQTSIQQQQQQQQQADKVRTSFLSGFMCGGAMCVAPGAYATGGCTNGYPPQGIDGGRRADYQAAISVAYPQEQEPENTSTTANHNDDASLPFGEHDEDFHETLPKSFSEISQQRQEGPQDEDVAELGPPPVHAIRQVIFDDDDVYHHDLESSVVGTQQFASTAISRDSTDDPLYDGVPSKKNTFRNIGLGILALAIILGITIPISKLLYKEHNKVPAPPPFPECFTSTAALIRAQVDHPQHHLFIICPNTTIHVGTLSYPTVGDAQWVDGDRPLMVMRSNIEVRCGQDGSVSNNCVLFGGSLQVLLAPYLPSREPMLSQPTDNVTIRGITLSGQISANYTFDGSSVLVSNPGKNVRFVNCLWENLKSPHGIVYVGTNTFQALANMEPLDVQTAEVLIVNSTFRNITSDGPVVAVWKQTIVLQGCSFHDVGLSPLFQGQCRVGELCQSLVSCLGRSICELQDLCVEKFEYAAYGAILTANGDARINVTGSRYFDGIELHASLGALDICESGFVWVDKDGEQPLCMYDTDPSIDMDWQIAKSCWLDSPY